MADAIGRQQLKWFALALLAAIVGVAVAALGAVVSEQPPETGLVLFGFTGALVPVAIGIAILRHGLYDIDRLISRSLGYALVTGVLAAVFAVTAIGLSAVLGSLAQGESLAVACIDAPRARPLRPACGGGRKRRSTDGSIELATTPR